MRQSWKLRFKDAIPAIVVFCSILSAAYLIHHLAVVNAERLRDARLHEAAEQAFALIDGRMDIYVTLLQAGQAFVQASDVLDKSKFSFFVKGLKLQERYPGFQGLGFAERVQAADKDVYVAQIRAAGDPEYTIKSVTRKGDLYPIKFIEPRDRRNLAALGYDMFSETIRRTAMERARDRAELSASGPVSLLQEITDEKQYGFLLYVPVFRGAEVPGSVEERREKIYGYVYGAFRTGDVFSSLKEQLNSLGISIAVTDKREDQAINVYAMPDLRPGRTMVFQRDYPVAGRFWTISFFDNTPADRLAGFNNLTGTAVPISIIFAGLILSWFVYRETRTARRMAEVDLELFHAQDKLKMQNQLINVAREPVLVLDGEGRILTWNLGCETLYGYTSRQALGRRSFELLLTEFPITQEDFWAQLARQKQIVCEVTQRAKDGSVVVVEAVFERFTTADGVRILESHWDIRERKETERQLTLLVREMTHRVKNILAVVQSLINNTLPSTPDFEPVRRTLVSRLHALSRAQDIATKSDEHGADLLEIVQIQMRGFESQAFIEGDQVFANANFAQMFALVIHELTTNAMKYGALSTPEGNVYISLKILSNNTAARKLQICWTEKDGPRVERPAATRFGTRLILSAIAGAGREKASIEYAPEGLKYRVTVPLVDLEP